MTLQTPQLKLEKAKVSFVPKRTAWLYVAISNTIQGELDQQRNNNERVHLIYVHIVAASLKSLLFTEIIFSMICVHFCVFVKLVDVDE